MGLSIYYSGQFNPQASLTEMIEEIKDIVIVNKWKYAILEPEFPKNDLTLPWGNKEIYHPENLYGIIFTPPKCETVEITFLSNGYMSGIGLIKFWGNSTKPEEKEYLYSQFVKTQYAGPEIHKLIIHLFKYLEPKYFLNFKMIDEGYYWETNDEKLLNETFSKYTSLINGFGDCLESFPKNEGETTEDYILRMAKETKKLKKE